MTINRKHIVIPVLIGLSLTSPAWAIGIDDFNSWTQVADPAHPGMTGSIDSPSQVTLSANGGVPADTDIGYQSVDGNSVASSVYGHYFSIDQSFSIAVDYSLSGSSSIGLGGIGFGIGEDGDGMNGAGVGLAFINGTPALLAGAARVNDVTQTPAALPGAPTASGRFFIGYDQSNGNITFGWAGTPGAATPSETALFNGLQNQWNDQDLLVSFFLRSGDSSQPNLPPLLFGNIDAVFSNFEVLEGTPTVVPIPAAVWLFGSALGLLGWARRRT